MLNRIALVSLAMLAVLAAGCAAPEPSRYFLLAPTVEARSSEPTGVANGPIVTVGPVTIPPHLDRPDIVTRSDAYSLQLADFDRWAEPLKDNITRTIAQNLAVLLPTHRIVTYPSNGSVETDFQITVTVCRLDGDQTGAVTLSAMWGTYGRGGRDLIALERFVRSAVMPPTASAADNSVRNLVATQSDLVGEFSREIADALSRASSRSR